MVQATKQKKKTIKSSQTVIGGYLPSLILHPDRKHVEYVFNIINPVKDLLKEIGFNPMLLSDETCPDTHFGKTFEEISDEIILGVVILDGLRPNIMYEYGFLRGKNKLVIPIQDRSAFVAVKSFYPMSEYTIESIKLVTGLTSEQFQKLKNPPLGYFDHVSDRGGIKVVFVDSFASSDSPEHPRNKLEKELKNLIKRTPPLQVCLARYRMNQES